MVYLVLGILNITKYSLVHARMPRYMENIKALN